MRVARAEVARNRNDRDDGAAELKSGKQRERERVRRAAVEVYPGHADDRPDDWYE